VLVRPPDEPDNETEHVYLRAETVTRVAA